MPTGMGGATGGSTHEASTPIWRIGASLAAPAAVLARGGVLAIPTESSYGLAADPHSRAGVATIFRIKGRPPTKPLPIVAADPTQLDDLGIDPQDPTLAAVRDIWPAALTAILKLRPDVRLAATPTDDVGVRIPAFGRLRAILAGLGPVTATSANRAGEPAIHDPRHLGPLLDGEDAMILDAGVLSGGPPSTLVRILDGEWDVLRDGAFPAAQLPETPRLTTDRTARPPAPAPHRAPRTRD